MRREEMRREAKRSEERETRGDEREREREEQSEWKQQQQRKGENNNEEEEKEEFGLSQLSKRVDCLPRPDHNRVVGTATSRHWTNEQQNDRTSVE